jgi:hypothetical protein
MGKNNDLMHLQAEPQMTSKDSHGKTMNLCQKNHKTQYLLEIHAYKTP